MTDMIKSQPGGDILVLPSGKTFYANLQILGMTAFGGLTVTEGYDGPVSHLYFTPEDRGALADHMMKRWDEWGKL